MSSEQVQQPSPPVGPPLSAMSTSPLDGFKQWRASITPIVCNIGSAIERTPADAQQRPCTPVPADKSSTGKRDTPFDKTLRVLEKAMQLSEKKATKRTYAVFRAVWDWFVGIAGSLSYERVFTLAVTLYLAGPTLMPLARSAMMELVKKMVCMASHRLMDALQGARARAAHALMAFYDAPPLSDLYSAADGGVMRASSSPVAIPIGGVNSSVNALGAVDGGVHGMATSLRTSRGRVHDGHG